MAEYQEESLENSEGTEVFQALQKAWKESPEDRKTIQKILKKNNPKLEMPLLDAEERIDQMQSHFQKQLDERDAKMRAERAAQDDMLADMRLTSQKFSKEDITAIRKKMAEEGIGSLDTAAKLFKLEQQAAAPTPGVWAKAEKPTQGIPAEALKDSSKLSAWARSEAHAAVDQLKASRG